MNSRSGKSSDKDFSNSNKFDEFDKLKNYYNGISKGYKDLYHQEQINKISLVKNYIPSSGDVLDLGSADGVLNSFFDLKNSSLNFISVDISLELLKLNSNLESNKFCANAQSLPFDDSSFDYIFSFTVIQDTIDVEEVFRELRRVIKPNGKIILSFLKRSQKKDFIIDCIVKFFVVLEKFEEEKDFIFALENKV